MRKVHEVNAWVTTEVVFVFQLMISYHNILSHEVAKRTTSYTSSYRYYVKYKDSTDSRMYIGCYMTVIAYHLLRQLNHSTLD